MKKRKKEASVGERPRVSEKSVTLDPWVWIEGLHKNSADEEVWQPLYCIRRDKVLRGRGMLRYILNLEKLPAELQEFEDFRLTDNAPETPLEGSESPASPVEAQPSPKEPLKPPKAPQKPPRAKCGVKLRGDPCVRSLGHYPDSMHKTREGKKWRSR